MAFNPLAWLLQKANTVVATTKTAQITLTPDADGDLVPTAVVHRDVTYTLTCPKPDAMRPNHRGPFPFDVVAYDPTGNAYRMSIVTDANGGGFVGKMSPIN